MSDTQDTATTDFTITNFERTTVPRQLTPEEIADGYKDPHDSVTDPFYAIYRADGYVGHNIGRHTKSPKIEVLFVTADGRRALTDFHRATESDNEHDFDGTYPVVRQQERDTGANVPEESAKKYAKVVDDLYKVDNDD
jgi:hypothetical protein